MMKGIQGGLVLLLVSIAMQVGGQSTSLLSQEVALTPEIKSVEGHLNDLRGKGLQINYVDNHVDLNRPIRLVKETDSLQNLLKDILREEPLQIIEKNNAIYLVRMKVIPPPPIEPKKGKNFVVLGMRF
ncbi:MAG: hypothetical protein U0Y10_12715 [Spirosomataceae bacterium]